MSGRNPPVYCTLALNDMQVHQNRGNKHDESGYYAAQVVACLVNLSLVRFTSYPNKDAKVLGRHWTG